MTLHDLILIALTAGGTMILVAIIAWAMLAAPEGYEDDEGFHTGPDPRPEQLVRSLERMRRDG